MNESLPVIKSMHRNPVMGAVLVVDLAFLVLAGFSLLLQQQHLDSLFWLGLIAAVLPLISGCFSGFRVLGYVPVGLMMMVASLSLLKAEIVVSFAEVLLGVGTTFAVTALLFYHGLQFHLLVEKPSRVKNHFTKRNFDDLLLDLVAVLAVAMIAWYGFAPEAFSQQAWPFLLGGLVLLSLFALVRLFRSLYELVVELTVRVMYRMTVRGPGKRLIPFEGPLLVISNHACFWDPMFVAGILPRPITPMMTARYYDLWFLTPILKHVFGVIRVPEEAMRRDAPELKLAIEALKAGHCVIIFPEGYLRRKEEVPLRRFGRGIWEILSACPDTPVLPIWIEGGWGSYGSYKDGPPLTNKPFDIRRPIGIGVSAPIVLKKEILESHMSTRMYLMNEVSGARKHIGLPPLPPFGLISKEEAETEKV